MITLHRVRDAWKKLAAITLQGRDASALGDTLVEWSEVLRGNSDTHDDV